MDGRHLVRGFSFQLSRFAFRHLNYVLLPDYACFAGILPLEWAKNTFRLSPCSRSGGAGARLRDGWLIEAGLDAEAERSRLSVFGDCNNEDHRNP